jgi:hypothetical protein
MERQMERLKNLFPVLLGMFGGDRVLAELVLTVFRAVSTLRLVTAVEAVADAAAHGSAAHNADRRYSVQVRDERDTKVPLVLKPVTSEGATLAYALCLDSNKVKDLGECESFAKMYLGKTLSAKCSFAALAAVCFARQTGEDIVNNLRQTELRQAQKQTLFSKQSAPFLKLGEAEWLQFRIALDADLAEFIDRKRLRTI